MNRTPDSTPEHDSRSNLKNPPRKVSVEASRSESLLENASLPRRRRSERGPLINLHSFPFERGALSDAISTRYRKLCETYGYVLGAKDLAQIHKRNPEATPRPEVIKSVFGSFRALRQKAKLPVVTGRAVTPHGHSFTNSPNAPKAHLAAFSMGPIEPTRISHPKSISRVYFEPGDRFLDIAGDLDQVRSALEPHVARFRNSDEYKDALVRICVGDPRSFQNPDDDLSTESLIDGLFDKVVDVHPALSLENFRLAAPPQSTASAPVSAPWTRDSLTQELSRQVFGQEEAIGIVASALMRREIGTDLDPETGEATQPIASLLLLGRTGVGKTQLAKAIASKVLGDRTALLRIDCSEYGLSHEYAKLIGAPPGYIGHNDGGILTEALKARPRLVILFDEVDLAHTKVHNLLLQLLDEGRITDSRGVVVSARESIILLTSNLGVGNVDALERRVKPFAEREIGDVDRHGAIMAAVRETFRPEFLNRLTAVSIFKDLDPAVGRQIIDERINQLVAAVRQKGRLLVVPEEVRAEVLRRLPRPFNGRLIKREIARLIENPFLEVAENHGAGTYRFQLQKQNLSVAFIPEKAKGMRR